MTTSNPAKLLTPIERMIDASGLRCTICRAPMGRCDCWTECKCGWSYPKDAKCSNPIHRKKARRSDLVDIAADAHALLPCPLSDDQIRYMVDRFLGWRLPKPWTPDNGISYARPNYMHAPADHDWPTGTNLFDWSQAEAMVRYMVEGMPGLAARPKVEDAEVEAAITYLGDEVPEEKAIADLLERLAGYLSDMTADFRDQATKLAEREAELAKADAVIVKLTPLIPPQWSDNGSWTANDQAVCENAHVQHAARQQQRASAEPTSSKAGETR